VDRALRGQDVDRVPLTFWYHFGLEKLPPFRHAQATLDFHRNFRTDLVKVMSDYPYPKPAGKWYELRVEDNPFPEQIRALEIIRDGLAGSAYFVETIFNPWNVAEKLSSKEAVLQLKAENPQALLEALEAIAESEANHAKKALITGAAGIFLAIANAQEGILSPADYAKFSQPFDRLILDAVSAAPLNTLHLHGDKVYLDRFLDGWPAAAINYSAHGTGLSIGHVRARYPGLIIAGLDERNFRKLTEAELRAQWQAAAAEAGKRFVLAPGCSIPNDTEAAEIRRLLKVVGA
jgi:uroporphyrinogen decarboxylase